MPRDEMLLPRLVMQIPHDTRTSRKERQYEQDIDDLMHIQSGLLGCWRAGRLQDQNRLSEEDQRS